MLVAMFAEEWGQRLAAAREEQLRVRHVNIYFMPHIKCSCPDCVEETEWPAKKRRLYLGDEVHIGYSAENVKIRNLRKRISRQADAVECNLHLVELLKRISLGRLGEFGYDQFMLLLDDIT